MKYLAHSSDQEACVALRVLSGLGVETCLLDNSACPPNDHESLVGLVVSSGRFPSRYCRVMSPKDNGVRGFIIPEWAENLSRLIIIRPGADAHVQRFTDSICSCHGVVSGWRQPKKKRGKNRRRETRQCWYRS